MTPFSEDCGDCSVCEDEEASRQWDAILADEATRSFRAEMADRWYRLGRAEGYVDFHLAIPLSLKKLPWCVDAYVRGYQRGQDEREVDETVAARERLPRDDREPPERED